MKISVQHEDFDAATEADALTHGRTDIGALVSFTGLCRGRDGVNDVRVINLECYVTMAIAELTRLGEEAQARWPLQGLTIIHRYGRILPGERIVLVIAASAHRQAAFEAAEFLMDFLKTNAPFWKAEETDKGTGWVAAKASDDKATERWAKDH